MSRWGEDSPSDDYYDEEWCPLCGEPSSEDCKCTASPRTCANGHRWMYCQAHAGKYIIDTTVTTGHVHKADCRGKCIARAVEPKVKPKAEPASDVRKADHEDSDKGLDESEDEASDIRAALMV